MKGFSRKARSRVHGPRAEERRERDAVAVTFHKAVVHLSRCCDHAQALKLLMCKHFIMASLS